MESVEASNGNEKIRNSRIYQQPAYFSGSQGGKELFESKGAAGNGANCIRLLGLCRASDGEPKPHADHEQRTIAHECREY